MHQSEAMTIGIKKQVLIPFQPKLLTLVLLEESNYIKL